MKVFIFACLLAAVFAEPESDPKADPYYLYSGYSSPYYGGFYLARPSYYSGSYYGYPRSVYGGYWKRDAESNADPYYLYSGYSSPYWGGSYVSRPYYGGSYYGGSSYLGYPGYTTGYWKRSAESNADPYYLYSSYGYPTTSYWGGSYLSTPYYGGLGYRTGYWKREAESDAKADPAVIYNSGLITPTYYNTGYHTLSAGLVPHTPLVSTGYAYPTVGYTSGYWKRSAESNADPYYLYSGSYYRPGLYSSYAYPRAYGYGTYGTGWGGRYYW